MQSSTSNPHDRRVFSLRGHQVSGPMTLRETPGRIEAFDSTGTAIGVAQYLRGTGWVIVRTIYYRQIIGTQPDKEQATLALRHMVGDMT